VIAYIFQDDDLVNNLMGLAPFADRHCTAVFKATSFSLYHGKSSIILTGERNSTKELWQVRFGAATESDGIPPPSSALDKGIYIEANNVNLHDNASYVRFVHASLGYPAPTTFLHAVMAGYITTETQYPRLTGKMVRKHMPNALATAKGHLDRKPSATPHANSDAVSALRRHDTRSQHD
jgi:hypothetical protein